MDENYKFEDISDQYTEEIVNKSTASNQSNVEIIIKPSRCAMTKCYKKFFDRIRNFDVRPDDTWVITYPKSGTTWTQELVWLLKNNFDYEQAKSRKLRDRVPFLELEAIISKFEIRDEASTGTIEKAENLPSPRCIKSHLPIELLPKQLWTVKPKIVYVTRDPRDVAISYYHHFRLWNGYRGKLEDFVDVFLKDRTIYSPYWGHVLGFMNLKDKSHILHNTYEDMKRDLPEIIRKTGKFLGTDVTEEEVEKLNMHLSFKSMKENQSVNSADIAKKVKDDINADDNDDNLSFIRRGESGEWRNILGTDTLEKFKVWNECHLKDKNLMPCLEGYVRP